MRMSGSIRRTEQKIGAYAVNRKSPPWFAFQDGTALPGSDAHLSGPGLFFAAGVSNVFYMVPKPVLPPRSFTWYFIRLERRPRLEARSNFHEQGPALCLCRWNKSSWHAINAVPKGESLDRDLGETRRRLHRYPVRHDRTGMARGILPQIFFQPFLTRKESGRGVGLELAINRGIVERRNGRIEVESELSRGTTFTVSLPAQESGFAGSGRRHGCRDEVR